MTVTANNTSTVYGLPVAGFSASVSGGTGGDLASPVQFQVVGGGTNAGTYALHPFGAISSTRALNFANGTLTVNPALLTVTANDTKRLQGASSPGFQCQLLRPGQRRQHQQHSCLLSVARLLDLAGRHLFDPAFRLLAEPELPAAIRQWHADHRRAAAAAGDAEPVHDAHDGHLPARNDDERTDDGHRDAHADNSHAG